VRAIVFEKPGEFSLTEVPDPVSGPREAVVRVEAVGICGTDLHVLDGEFAPTVFPIVPGHEASGVVVSVGEEVTNVAPGVSVGEEVTNVAPGVSVGEEVTNVAPGDPVALDPSFYCGECWVCMVGRGNLCENWDGGGVARTDGSAAELVRSPAKNLHCLPSSVDLALAALIERHAFALSDYGMRSRSSAPAPGGSFRSDHRQQNQ
jgi:D-arabinose 1-dehydrogenase-like Zn-dependent alcohol dehydrogenase